MEDLESKLNGNLSRSFQFEEVPQQRSSHCMTHIAVTRISLAPQINIFARKFLLHHLMNIWFWGIDGINYFHFREEDMLLSMLNISHNKT